MSMCKGCGESLMYCACEDNPLGNEPDRLTGEYHKDCTNLITEIEFLKEVNKIMTLCLADISNACIGDIAMGYKLDSEAIGKWIFEATGLNNPDLNKRAKRLNIKG